MCGIFGIVINERSGFTPQLVKRAINDLFKLSESRGKEAAGIAVSDSGSIQVFKDAVPASILLKNKSFQHFFDDYLKRNSNERFTALAKPLAMIGHSRLVTNGAMEIHANNQPVISSGIVGIHNGIIVNDADLWRANPSLPHHLDVDTEVMLAMIRKEYQEKGSLVGAFQNAYQKIKGTASVAFLFDDLNILSLATDSGSLYACIAENVFIFASERYILKELTKQRYLQEFLKNSLIQQIKPRTGLLVDTLTAKVVPFGLLQSSEDVSLASNKNPKRRIEDVVSESESTDSLQKQPQLPLVISDSLISHYEIDAKAIGALRRCTKCVLPETMPFIEFDEEGVCNYCRGYRPIRMLGIDQFQEYLDPFRQKNGEPDCRMTFSGGRDSSYGLHYLKEVLKMNPVAFTYDWGMVTDLGRRNQARMCGQLGIEHILVSADIKHKRDNIRKNVLAWLKQPHLGTVPLFMAGDKQYFYYANKVQQQLDVDIVILGENLLETTKFKSGFCGIKPTFGTDHTYTLSISNQAKMALFYGKQYLTNPAYLNRSIIDTIGAFASYYFIPHDFVNLYDYIRWDEAEISSTLINEYDWEVAKDTKSTWRIGDGTASFYNYIYYMMAGFSENDTFRSNQIREGSITREQALDFLATENQPRFDSIQWYCNTIGIDMESALARIKQAPKLYKQ
jgi:glutamine---fructose-6-phosphate transaminase (isomerizing)